MKRSEVIGRNGFRYDAEHVSGNVYVVGRYLVIVRGGYCRETIGRATKAAIEEIKKRARWLAGAW